MDEQRAWIKSRRKKRLRMLAAALALCLLFTTYPDILETLSVLAAGTQGGDDTRYVAGFEELAEEVREQTVPLGTEIEELTLPDALEAYITVEEEASEEEGDSDGFSAKEDNTVSGAGTDTETGGADGSTETDAGTGETGTDEEGDEGIGGTGTDETGDKTGTDGNNGEGGEDTDGDNSGDNTGSTGDNTGSTGDNTDNTGDTGSTENSGDIGSTGAGTDENNGGADAEQETSQDAGNTAGETPAADADNTNNTGSTDAQQEQSAQKQSALEETNGESAPSAKAEPAAFSQETYTVTLPVYAAGNELEIETLEQPAQTEQVTIENIIWESDPSYDEETEGVYIFTPVLPEGYALSEGVSLPEIRVEAVMMGDDWTEEDYARMKAGLQDNPALLTEADVLAAAPELAPQAGGRMRAAGRAAAGHPGTYLTTYDNEDNAGSGKPDGDLDEELYGTSGNHPIEANIFIPKGELPQKSCYIAVRTFDVDWMRTPNAEYDKLFINGVRVGTLTGLNGDWNTSYYRVPLSCLREGKNTVQVEIWNCKDSSRFGDDDVQDVLEVGAFWHVTIDWMQLVCDGGSGEGVEEFSLKLKPESSTVKSTKARIGVETVIKSANTSATYHTEYSIMDSHGFIVGSFQEKDVKDGAHDITVTMPLDSATGTYTVQGLLKNAKGEILATDSAQFRYIKGSGPVFVPKISHTLSIETLTRQNVTITPKVVDGAGCTNITFSYAGKTVTATTATANGEYDFTVNYKDSSGKSDSFIYTAEVTNIDKTPPAITYNNAEISAETVDAAGEQLGQAWTVTDNVSPREKCTVTYSLDCSKAADFKKLQQAAGGTIDVTVTATDEAGNKNSVTRAVKVASMPPELSKPTAVRSGTASTFTLTAEVLTAVSAVTESGFVWGTMQNPTLTLNQGSGKNTLDVKTGNKIQVKAMDIVDGATYYCRAYAKAGEVTYYSEQTSFGINAKSYGAFTITNNNNNTFTITRTGGTDGAQTVYFRTVNGSAVGGTHFEHKAGTVVFGQGEPSKTITVTEKGVTAAYDSKPATSYSNADRTYQVEIYRVDGGGTLGNTTKATRKMAIKDTYTVNRNVYTTETSGGTVTADPLRRWVEDCYWGSAGDIRFNSDRHGNKYTEDNYRDNYSFTYTPTYNTYLQKTTTGWLFRYSMYAHEQEDGWEHLWVGNQKPSIGLQDNNIAPDGAAIPLSSGVGTAKFTGSFEMNEGSDLTVNVPQAGSGVKGACDGRLYHANGTMKAVNGNNYISFGKGETAHCYFTANGNAKDRWYIINHTSYSLPDDTEEPSLLGIAPMVGTAYKVGDEVVVSLIFNEIVDKQNSTLGSVSLNTSWGKFTYAGGADTNVLYFKGTVPSNATGTLQVTGIDGKENIRDMCDNDGTVSDGSGSVTVSVDTTTPAVSITNPSLSNGTAQGTVKGTNVTTLKYAWTQSGTMPVTGWTGCANGTVVKTRQASGKWYLHVLGTYNGTGANDWKYKEFDFGTPEKPASPPPSLKLSANNTNWAQTRPITITKVPANAALTVKTPSGTEQDLGTSVPSYTADKNGMYTFTMTVDEETVQESILVSKLDHTAPTVVLKDAGAAKDGDGNDILYHTLRMTATAADSESGVQAVKYCFTTSQSAPAAGNTAWQTATATADGVYVFEKTAASTTVQTFWLHVMATDKVGNAAAAKTSPAYKLVKEQDVKITLTAPTGWTRENAALTWKITEAGAGSCTVSQGETTLKTGQNRNATGTFTVTENGVYSVSVRDQNGNTGSALCAASHIDREAPEFTLSVPSGYADQKTVTLSGVTDDLTRQYNTAGMTGLSGSGVAKQEYLAPGADADAWTEFTGKTFTATKNGTYQVKLTDKVGNTGTESIEVSGIDVTAPEVTCTVNGVKNAASGWYTGSPVSVVLSFEDKPGKTEGGTPSGIKTVQYKPVSDNTTKPTDGLTSLSASSADFKNGGFTYKITGNGQYYLYYKVTDNAGKVTDGFSELIQKDSCNVTAAVTGPESGQPESDGLTMQVSLTYGPGGGVLYAGPDGNETQLAAMSGSSGIDVKDQTVTKDYQVTGAGAYGFRYHSTASDTDVESDFHVYKVTFDRQDGTDSGVDGSADSTIPAQLVWHDGTDGVTCKVAKPADPVRTGYAFGGWYTDEDCTGSAFDFENTQVKADATLYAKWMINNYNVTYHLTNPDGSTYTPEGAFGKYTFGEKFTLPAPAEVEGYAFRGWYGDAKYSDGPYTQIGETATGDKTYYGYYEDIAAPAITAALTNGETADGGRWYNASDIPIPEIQLTYSDNKGVSEIKVKVDDGSYTPVTGAATGDPTKSETTARYALQEGVHTYIFKAADAAGNETETAALKVKLDTAKPEFGTLIYENKAKDILDWIIGKESLIIIVPVTDNGSNGEPGSGVDEISYTLTPADVSTGATETTGTAEVKDGRAEITVSADFKGTVKISGNDAAGNAADDKTIGASGGAGGVIVEDNAPVISALADRGPADDTAQTDKTEISDGFYATAPAITVTVKDDIDHAVTAGIASVTCLIGKTDYPVNVSADALKEEITFTIPADKIPTGTTTITIEAEDNAGNSSEKKVTLKVNGAEKKPAAKINYRTEKLTGLEPDADYTINGAPYRADGGGCIDIDESWLGSDIEIVKKGNGSETTDSPEQTLPIPARPAKPTPTGKDETGPDKKDGKLTGLAAGTVYEISQDGGKNWVEKTADGSGEIKGVDTPAEYTVRVAPVGSFRSLASDPVKVDGYHIPVTYMVNGSVYDTSWAYYGKAPQNIPAVPKKADAGDATYVSEWCVDKNGTPADLKNITKETTVYACYTVGYNVTLQGGIGCSLTAAPGNASPVKEGGSFTLQFTLGNGYEKTDSFAVKVNGAAVALQADGTYTIEDIRQDQTVTVEGIRKKPSSGGSGKPGHDSGGQTGGENNPPADGNPPADDNSPTDNTPSADDKQTADKTKPDGTTPGGITPDGKTPGTETPDSKNPDGKNPDGKNPDGKNSDGTNPDGTPQEGIGPGEKELGETTTDDKKSPGDNDFPDGVKLSDGAKLTVVTEPVTIEDDRIVSVDKAAAGNVSGMEADGIILQLADDAGAVIVTVVCEEEEYAAGVSDTIAVANAVLTPEQIQLVGGGETIEILIDVKDITDSISLQDKEIIEGGIEESRKDHPGLTLGMYIDISMFVKIGEGDWNTITHTDEPVDVVIGIPETLKAEGRKFTIIRSHDGEYALLPDIDDDPDTITISTNLFSAYAIAYEQAGGSAKCRLCHICPTFLGICYFIWLAVILAIVLIIWILARRRKEEEEKAQ